VLWFFRYQLDYLRLSGRKNKLEPFHSSSTIAFLCRPFCSSLASSLFKVISLASFLYTSGLDSFVLCWPRFLGLHCAQSIAPTLNSSQIFFLETLRTLCALVNLIIFAIFTESFFKLNAGIVVGHPAEVIQVSRAKYLLRARIASFSGFLALVSSYLHAALSLFFSDSVNPRGSAVANSGVARRRSFDGMPGAERTV
jgi:hypothetical protein